MDKAALIAGYAADYEDIIMSTQRVEYDEEEPTQPKHVCQRTILKQTQVSVRDSCVVLLQHALNKWAGGSTPLLADGIFGEATKHRTEYFQLKNALIVDGIVGPKTWAALGHYL